MNETKLWLTVAVIALCTALLRFLPFWLWSGNRNAPKWIEKLGQALPYAVMGMLVVYCLKDVSFAAPSGYLPALIATLTVSITYIAKRNTLLSIICGTVCHMLLVQLVF